MSIYSKLAVAQANVGTILKSANNAFEGYRYVSCEDVIFHARKALLDAGLVFLECGTVIERAESGMMATVAYALHDTETDESVRFAFDIPIHMDRKGAQGDKQSAAARSYSMAYALRGILMIDRVEKPRPMDDVEPDARAPAETDEAAEKAAVWKALSEARKKAGIKKAPPKSLDEAKAELAELLSDG